MYMYVAMHYTLSRGWPNSGNTLAFFLTGMQTIISTIPLELSLIFELVVLLVTVSSKDKSALGSKHGNMGKQM